MSDKLPIFLTPRDPSRRVHCAKFASACPDLAQPGPTLERREVAAVGGLGVSKVRRQLRHFQPEEAADECRRRTPWVMKECSERGDGRPQRSFIGALDPSKGKANAVLSMSNGEVMITLLDDWYDFQVSADVSAPKEMPKVNMPVHSSGTTSTGRRRQVRLDPHERARVEAERAARVRAEDAELDAAEERMARAAALTKRWGAAGAGREDVGMNSRRRGRGGGGRGRRGGGDGGLFDDDLDDSDGFSEMEDPNAFQDDEGDHDFGSDVENQDDDFDDDAALSSAGSDAEVRGVKMAQRFDKEYDNDDVFGESIIEALDSDDDSEDNSLEMANRALESHSMPAVAGMPTPAASASASASASKKRPLPGASGGASSGAGVKAEASGGNAKRARTQQTSGPAPITAAEVAQAVRSGFDTSKALIRKFRDEGRLTSKSQAEFIGLVKDVCKIDRATQKLSVKGKKKSKSAEVKAEVKAEPK